MARHQHEDTDRSDPATRAAARLARTRSSEQRQRSLAALTLAVIGAVGVFTAEPITGQAGATVGAVVGALLLVALGLRSGRRRGPKPKRPTVNSRASGTSSEATPPSASTGTATPPGPTLRRTPCS